MTAPVFLKDEPWLEIWLGWFLDRLDKREGAERERAITRRITKSTLPALYQFDQDTRGRWALLQNLSNEHNVFEIRYAKNLAPYHEPYENAQFRLNPQSEPLLREWLDRPKHDPHLLAWQRAVNRHADHFIDHGNALLVQRPSIPGLTPDDTVKAFVNIAGCLDQALTLREISARCFSGDSKVLDNRHDLLVKLYGEKADSIQLRPLLLTAWAPSDFTQLLIVENQDSFLRLVENSPEGFALLYSGGFRAGANRLSTRHTRFAFLPGSDAERFNRHWLSAHTSHHFWGDLDFAGMGILKALRSSLPNIRAWETGYIPMMEILESGGGHPAVQAGKESHSDPGTTGCLFADEHLLPALRASRRLVDQEVVAPSEIKHLKR